jgi:hypothetical protein
MPSAQTLGSNVSSLPYIVVGVLQHFPLLLQEKQTVEEVTVSALFGQVQAV